MSSGKSTRFFYLSIIALVIGGVLLFLYKFNLIKTTWLIADNALFTPDELCALLKMEPDKKAEFLLEKGFTENNCDSTCISYTLESKGVEIFGIQEQGTFFYGLYFDLTHKDVYLCLMKQLNKSTTFSIEKDKEGNTNYYYKIGENCLLGDSGWQRKDRNYQITIMDDFIFQEYYNSKSSLQK